MAIRNSEAILALATHIAALRDELARAQARFAEMVGGGGEPAVADADEELEELEFLDEEEELEILEDEVDVEPPSRPHAETNYTKVVRLLNETVDRIWSAEEIAEHLGIPYGSARLAVSAGVGGGDIKRLARGQYTAVASKKAVRRPSRAEPPPSPVQSSNPYSRSPPVMTRVETFFAANPAQIMSCHDVARALDIPARKVHSIGTMLTLLTRRGSIVRSSVGRYQYNPAYVPTKAPPPAPPESGVTETAPESKPAPASLTDRILGLLAAEPQRHWLVSDVEKALGEKQSAIPFILRKLAARERIEELAPGKYRHRSVTSAPIPVTLGGD